MIERIVLTKLRAPDTRGRVADEVRQALSKVPDLHEARVGLPADELSAKSWDLSLILVCEDEQALARTLAHEAFQRCHERLAAEGECVKAWSFQLSPRP